MKKIIHFFNHEIWHQCAKCGRWFDRRMCGDNCPDCGTSVNAMP
jgi:rRNA maturation endonuclease Nob1